MILADFAAEDGPRRFADGQNITVAGVVTSTARAPRNNSLMAYVIIEDEMASIELMCFSRCIEQCGSFMQVNSPVLVRGKLSVRDEKPPQILCDTVYPLQKDMAPPPGPPASRREAPKSATIYIRVPGLESDAFRHIRLVMTMFEGETPVKIRLADTGKLVGTHCLNHPALLQECREWLGEENVVVKRNNKLQKKEGAALPLFCNRFLLHECCAGVSCFQDSLPVVLCARIRYNRGNYAR